MRVPARYCVGGLRMASADRAKIDQDGARDGREKQDRGGDEQSSACVGLIGERWHAILELEINERGAFGGEQELDEEKEKSQRDALRERRDAPGDAIEGAERPEGVAC